MKHFFIVNPASGTNKKFRNVFESIKTVFEKRKESFIIHNTTAVGEATGFVRSVCESSDEPVRFYACGGDGTINETALGLIGYDHAELAVIPLGTGNDFVRNFENKENFFDIDAQLDGERCCFDLLRYNDKYSVNMINMGFDCQVAKQVPKLKKLRIIPSKLAFIIGVVQKFATMPKVKAKIFIDGEEQKENELLLCAIANGCFCGGGFKSSPLADLNDGVVDICIIKPISRMKFISIIGSYKDGTYLSNEKCQEIATYKKCRDVEIRFEKPTDVCIDGEIELLTSLKISSVSNALNMCVPRGCIPNSAKEKEPIGACK